MLFSSCALCCLRMQLLLLQAADSDDEKTEGNTPQTDVSSLLYISLIQ